MDIPPRDERWVAPCQTQAVGDHSHYINTAVLRFITKRVVNADK
jgi:hypothetical protein